VSVGFNGVSGGQQAFVSLILIAFTMRTLNRLGIMAMVRNATNQIVAARDMLLNNTQNLPLIAQLHTKLLGSHTQISIRSSIIFINSSCMWSPRMALVSFTSFLAGRS
jgi:hypothetical protein